MEGIGVIRNLRPEDFDRIAEIHKATGFDYNLPDLASDLIVVSKVYELDGVIRMAGVMRYQVELFYWLDPSDWTQPMEKLKVMEQMALESFEEAATKGIDCCVLYVPPGKERFADLLEARGLFKRNRHGWMTMGRMLNVEKV